MVGRSIGLDVHRDFCQVAIADGGRARSAGKVAAAAEQLELFAQSLAPDDRGGDGGDRYQQPGPVARKLRRLELAAGAPHRKPGPKAHPVWASGTELQMQRRLAEQAEASYRRLIADWQASSPNVGAGATPERASQRPSKGKAARQAESS